MKESKVKIKQLAYLEALYLNSNELTRIKSELFQTKQ